MAKCLVAHVCSAVFESPFEVVLISSCHNHGDAADFIAVDSVIIHIKIAYSCSSSSPAAPT